MNDEFTFFFFFFPLTTYSAFSFFIRLKKREDEVKDAQSKSKTTRQWTYFIFGYKVTKIYVCIYASCQGVYFGGQQKKKKKRPLS